MAAADLGGDGTIEVVVTTTNTSSTGSQVFVFDASGRIYHPKGAPTTSWPRFNRLAGAANDAHFNGIGNHGYGAYGENVGIGNLDDDPQLEIVVTFDNHQINVFNDDGTSVLASPWFTNRQSGFEGRRLGWGQFIRWLSPAVEANQYHRHVGPWPDVRKTMWLQWTASPPTVADLDRDGSNEVDRAAERGGEGAVRDAGLRVHGARRGAARRRPVGDAAQGLRHAAHDEQAGRASRRRLVSAERDPGSDRRRPERRRAPGDRRLRPRRLRVRRQPGRQAALALRLRARRRQDLRLGGRGGRPEPRRPAGADLRDVRARAGRRAPRRPLLDGQAPVRPPAAASGKRRQRHRCAGGAVRRRSRRRRHARDRPHHLRPRDRRVPRPGSGTNCLPWPTGRANVLRNGAGPASAS